MTQTSLQNNRKTHPREDKRRMKILCLGTLMIDPCLEPLAF